jgi:hypothetical protein
MQCESAIAQVPQLDSPITVALCCTHRVHPKK